MSPLDLLVAVPLGFMLAALLAGRAARWLILPAAPAMAGLALWLALVPPDAAFLVGHWDLPLGILLRPDGVARLMVAATALVIGAVGLHALADPPEKAGNAAQAETFWPLIYLLWAGANAGFLTTDLFNLYVTLEMVSLAAVALAAMGSLEAALRYFMIALVGSLAYLLGVALLVGRYNTVDVTLLSQVAEPDLATMLALGLMTAGLLIKAALFPMHGWLPPAHAAAPAPASALLSAIAVKLGFVILLRLWFEAFPAVTGQTALHVLGGSGALAVIYGSVQAMRQQRLKALVAYSTVAQVGYLFLAFPLVAGAPDPSGAWAGMMLHAVAHMLAKAAMFLAAGLMLKAAAGDRIGDLGGLAQAMPMTVTAFGLAAVSLMGLPPSGGFTGKFLLLNAAIAQGAFLYAGVMILGGLLAAVYFFRALSACFAAGPAPRAPATLGVRTAAPLVLAGLAIVMGFAGSALDTLSAIAAPWAAPGVAAP
jgi:formate hydrogenlyase subunit 3/multisubunit Na+/H+ antiporter MnhD subunit